MKSITGYRFAVTWLNLVNGSSNYEVISKVFTNDGDEFGPEFLVSNESIDVKFYPVICPLLKGGLAIAWNADLFLNAKILKTIASFSFLDQCESDVFKSN